MTGDESAKRPASVQWAERRTLVYVFIHVPDCKKPDIKLSSDKLVFRGKDEEGTEFENILNFYKDIKVEDSKYSHTDRGIDFVLKKAEEGPYWNRLLKDNKKYHWLRIDFNRYKDEDDSDFDANDDGDFEEMMKKMGGLQSSSNDLDDLTDSDDGEEAEEEEAAA
ncbi:prostaglandin E synthase 3-like [Uloborus diversus]|uniref:prostaglandin E synthase 3-like n=1 Tax=Uloborus diversus TaxID=327109 RepID=UPI002409E06E|nr:prostaglandin E synthase 3-like [Uloborus diversus]